MTFDTGDAFAPNPEPDPDAWRGVAGAGGYEWWYFDADAEGGEVQVVAIVFDGFVFHPEYVRRLRRFESRPGKRPAPVARDYPCVYLAVYERGKLLAQAMSQARPGELGAGRSTPGVRLGSSGFDREADGGLRVRVEGRPWRLTWRGPRRNAGAVLSAELVYRPMLVGPGVRAAAARERVFLPAEATGADHRWIIAAPLCRAEGVVRIDATGAGAREIRLVGRGYHDHNFGSKLIGPGLRRWIWGRLLGSDRAVTFHWAQPTGTGRDEIHLIEWGDDWSVEGAGPERTADWSARSAWGLAYPRTLDLRGLSLRRPRLVDSTPFYLRLSYEAEYRGRLGRWSGDAFCEVAFPARLRWPILGRMIEMSIDRPV